MFSIFCHIFLTILHSNSKCVMYSSTRQTSQRGETVLFHLLTAKLLFRIQCSTGNYNLILQFCYHTGVKINNVCPFWFIQWILKFCIYKNWIIKTTLQEIYRSLFIIFEQEKFLSWYLYKLCIWKIIQFYIIFHCLFKGHRRQVFKSCFLSLNTKLYITVSVKNNKRLYCFHLRWAFFNTKLEHTENPDTIIVLDFSILWRHKRPL